MERKVKYLFAALAIIGLHLTTYAAPSTFEFVYYGNPPYYSPLVFSVQNLVATGGFSGQGSSCKAYNECITLSGNGPTGNLTGTAVFFAFPNPTCYQSFSIPVAIDSKGKISPLVTKVTVSFPFSGSCQTSRVATFEISPKKDAGYEVNWLP